MGLGGYKTPVPGLYLSGSGTHPIAGINGMPGMNAAKTLIKNLRKESGGQLGRSDEPARAYAAAPWRDVPASEPATGAPSEPITAA
jgi:hypothetical protein